MAEIKPYSPALHSDANGFGHYRSPILCVGELVATNTSNEALTNPDCMLLQCIWNRKSNIEGCDIETIRTDLTGDISSCL